MKIAYINGMDDLTLTASSEASGFAVENVQQEHLSKRWRTTDDTSENVVIDATALNPEIAFLAGHNLSASATVKIQGHATDSWGSPTVDITMLESDGVYYALTGFSSMAYWRFLITDPTNTDGYIEVGRLWLGDAVSAEGPHVSFSETHVNTSVSEISLSGQSYGDTRYEYRVFTMTYPYWTDTEKEAIELYTKTINLSQPHFVIFDEDNITVFGPVYAVLTNSVVYQHIMKLVKWSSQLIYREVF